MNSYILPFADLSAKDVALVGGKNASLGEMIHHLSPMGVHVPDGFALSTDAYFTFLSDNKLTEALQSKLNELNTQSLDNLGILSAACKALILKGTFSENLREQLRNAYHHLCNKCGAAISVAVRSSATAEDSPTASFAGQHESYLNVTGVDALLEAVHHCYASVFAERAIKYRLDNGFAHLSLGLSVGVQRMVRADKGCAGVVFTIEPETGNQNLIYLTGAWGLGESVVQGAVNTDEFYLFKPALANKKKALIYRSLGSKKKRMVYGETHSTQWEETPPALRDQYILSDEEINRIGQWCYQIEQHYKMPMDIEWAKDGITGELFIVQARPETIHAQQKKITLKEYTLKTKDKPLVTGKAIGKSIVNGKVRIIKSLADADKIKKGDIIVADITNPDWNALLRKAICIVTNKGGRTSHASIIARELGIPAVVGTNNATEKLMDDQLITVSCASGDEGLVYNGGLPWIEKETPLEKLTKTKTKPMFILADPMKALLYAAYPNEGVGLLRMEFIITNSVQVHPMALVKFHELPDTNEKKQIDALTRHYASKTTFFIERLAESIALVAAASLRPID